MKKTLFTLVLLTSILFSSMASTGPDLSNIIGGIWVHVGNSAVKVR